MANGGGIPGSTARFIRDHIDSLGQLEILLLLHGQPDSQCTAAQINDILRSNLDSVERRVLSLLKHGLIQRDESIPPRYRYAASTEELNAAVDVLAKSYRDFRSHIIDLIYAPRDRMQSFSDAFRLKEDPNEHR